MIFKLTCVCGRTLEVRAGDAGSSFPCACGKDMAVPSLSELKAIITAEEAQSDTALSAPRDTKRDLIFVVAVLLPTIALGVFAPVALAPVGLLMLLVARIWFAYQILREMAPANALIVFFIPFMPTLFLFNRFDVAWKPFLLGVLGFVGIGIAIAFAPTPQFSGPALTNPI